MDFLISGVCVWPVYCGLVRGVQSALFGTVRSPHATCVLKLACFHPLSKCVWSFVQQGEVRGLLKERKTPPALLANVCELTVL